MLLPAEGETVSAETVVPSPVPVPAPADIDDDFAAVVAAAVGGDDWTAPSFVVDDGGDADVVDESQRGSVNADDAHEEEVGGDEEGVAADGDEGDWKVGGDRDRTVVIQHHRYRCTAICYHR